MISGYNTDVRHRDLILHVQTEDKGTTNPSIESLVYFGGQIVSRRREGYRELISEGAQEGVIQKRIEAQHRAMIDAIRSGQLDERLIEMGAMATPGTRVEPGAVEAGPEGEDGPSLDQVILDYLSAEASQEQLVLVMDSADELRPGARATLVFRARTSHAGRPVPGTSVTVRLISTVDEPHTLGTGATGEDGDLSLSVSIPDVSQGSAALIVHATSPVGGAELKHLI